MRNMRARTWMLAAGCLVLLSGCTKSNIVQPDESAMEPDFNMYTNIVIDEDQLHEDVDDIYLDPSDYPMASAIDFSLHLDDGYVDIAVVVKDGTSAEDAAWYADVAVKGVNDQVAVQDFSYGESDTDTFGGLYQDNEVNLKVYDESSYKDDGEPMYETRIPKDTYMTFDIGTAE